MAVKAVVGQPPPWAAAWTRDRCIWVGLEVRATQQQLQSPLGRPPERELEARVSEGRGEQNLIC